MNNYFRSLITKLATPAFFVILLTCFGAFLRFYNLNWGAPFYFHPDERNIASSVSQLVFPSQMNPHFFAYGSLPIYIIFFTGIVRSFILSAICHLPFISLSLASCHLATDKFQISFEEAIIISRFYSAIFSVLLIPLLYLIGKKLKDRRTGLIASFLAVMSVGFIQFAHFGTFEMWLTLESVLLFYFCLLVLERHRNHYILLLGLVFGVSVATKVSNLALVLLPVLALFIKECGKDCLDFCRHLFIKTFPRREDGTDEKEKKLNTHFLIFIRETVAFLLIAIWIYFVTNPYVVLDHTSFTNSMRYESGVALGTMKVFYSGEFFNTVPVVFQFLRVYPFLLNPLMTLIFLFGFGYIIFLFIKIKRVMYIFLVLFYLGLFLSQAFFFVKWVRYMVPTLPFVYLAVSLLFSASWMRRQVFTEVIVVMTVLLSSIFALAYFMTAFVRPDTRIAAVQWARTTIPADAKILSEVYDLGITPFNGFFYNITLFNFYDLDNNTLESSPANLRQALANSDYIILPSQRIWKIRMLNEKEFPEGHGFYQQLFSGDLGFQKIYQTECDMLCKITYLGNPIFNYEETTSVFDRSEVIIFQKSKN